MKLSLTYPGLQLEGALASFSQVLVSTFQRVANAHNNPDGGATAARPTQQLVLGQPYFDTTLGKPVWWNGVANWTDATGAHV